MVIDKGPEIFLVRLDAYRNKIAEICIVIIGIVQLLVCIDHFFGINPFATVCIVFDLEGDVAIDRLNKDLIHNGYMGIFSQSTIIERCFCPVKFKLVGQFGFMNAAVILILELTIFD
ncbi:hypothetical protein D3C86_1016240 [compost metagenome]